MQGLVTTQGVESTAILVQDFCKNHFELRCFVVNGRIAAVVGTGRARLRTAWLRDARAAATKSSSTRRKACTSARGASRGKSRCAATAPAMRSASTARTWAR
jgi:hypothetical protein